jgi:hypothetical protein
MPRGENPIIGSSIEGCEPLVRDPEPELDRADELD